MHEITTQEIAFFALVWCVAFGSAIARSIHDGDFVGLVRNVGIGATSGFLALGVVGCWLDRGPDGIGNSNPWYWIGLASLIGGLGKEQDNVRVAIWNAIARVKVDK